MKKIKLLLSMFILFLGFNNISNAITNEIESFKGGSIKATSFNDKYYQLDKLLIITQDQRESYVVSRVEFEKNKPENIVVSEDLKNKILNFGAKLSSSEELMKLHNYKTLKKIIEDEIGKEVIIYNIELSRNYIKSNVNNIFSLDKMLVITKDKRKSYIIAKIDFGENKPENIIISEELKNKILNFGMNLSNSEDLIKPSNYDAMKKIIEDEIGEEVFIENIELSPDYVRANIDVHDVFFY